MSELSISKSYTEQTFVIPGPTFHDPCSIKDRSIRDAGGEVRRKVLALKRADGDKYDDNARAHIREMN